MIEEESYYPYGENLEGAEESRYLYTGKEKDKDSTDLYYYGVRYYDSATKHFIQPDSVIANIYDLQNLNRYSYVLNNLYKYVDPSGNYAELL